MSLKVRFFLFAGQRAQGGGADEVLGAVAEALDLCELLGCLLHELGVPRVAVPAVRVVRVTQTPHLLVQLLDAALTL